MACQDCEKTGFKYICAKCANRLGLGNHPVALNAFGPPKPTDELIPPDLNWAEVVHNQRNPPPLQTWQPEPSPFINAPPARDLPEEEQIVTNVKPQDHLIPAEINWSELTKARS